MKIILDSKDIDKIIRDTYDCVEKTDIKEDIEITITVNSDSLKKKISTSTKLLTPNKIVNTETVNGEEVSLEEKNQRSLKAGGMFSGGQDRVLARF